MDSNFNVKNISEVIKDQKKLNLAVMLQIGLIKKTGYDPTWDLFSNTFGWFQIKRELTPEQQQTYKETWERLYNPFKKGVL